MATVHKILSDLRNEMRLKIKGLTPPANQTHKFSRPRALDKQPLREMHKTRIFEIEIDPANRERVGFGCDQRGWKLRGAIVIGYPIETEWDDIMFSDYDAIYDVFNRSDCTVTGVAYRHVPDAENPSIETVDNEWRWMSVPTEVSIWADA